MSLVQYEINRRDKAIEAIRTERDMACSERDTAWYERDTAQNERNIAWAELEKYRSRYGILNDSSI